MDLNDTPEQAAVPGSRSGPGSTSTRRRRPCCSGAGALTDPDEILAARRAWQGQLAEGGLAGVDLAEGVRRPGRRARSSSVIISQEMRRARVPGILDVIGVGMLGPTIIAHGSDEQKSRYLGPMLHGDEVWCQLFSEPAAGSDLAAVQTRAQAERRRHRGRSTGRRSGRRTRSSPPTACCSRAPNADVPKHKGMTMFIVPMDAEGVTVRGLRQISGEAEFNEVFFDDVTIPGDSVVGGVDNGWGVGLTTLMFERLTIGLGSEGFGYNGDRFARGDRRRPGRREGQRRAPPARRDRRRARGDPLDRLPLDQRRSRAARSPGPEFGLAKVTTVNDADQGRRPDRRRARPRRARRGRRVGLHDLVPAGPEVAPAAPRRSCATRSASACWGCRPSRAWTRASRSASCAPRRRKGPRHEPEPVRRAGVPARGGARRAVAREDRRGRPRGARGRVGAARPVADWRSRPAGPAC